MSDPDPVGEEGAPKFAKKVDDDWKRKVEEEKERLSDPEPPPPRPRAAPDERRPAKGGGSEPEPEPGQEHEPEHAPAGSPFLRFVGDLANQALTALGAYPDPITRTRQVSLEQARYIIDVLRILKDKTKGNLTPDEHRVLDGLLYELQIQFVEMNR